VIGEVGQYVTSFTPTAYGVFLIAAMLFVHIMKDWRERAQLSAADRLARREGYAKDVSGLRVENRELRGELDRVRTDSAELVRILREEHEKYRKLCHDENDSLRGQIIHLENELTGTKRRLDVQAIMLAQASGMSLEEIALRIEGQARENFDEHRSR
jgi:hypothetical protein